MPVIAAVEGHCLGAGLQFALAADYLHRRTREPLGHARTALGHCADIGISVSARGRIRGAIFWPSLTYSARLFDGQAALAHGFAARLDAAPDRCCAGAGRRMGGAFADALLGSERIVNTLYGSRNGCR